VEAGFVAANPETSKSAQFRSADLQEVSKPVPMAGDFTLVLYPTVAMLDGRHAENPWLQELPDPISKVTWDNYACLAPAAAQRLGLNEGDVVRLETDAEKETSQALELPVFIQPGQHDRVIAVALGYGSKGTERFAAVGPNWIFGRSGMGEDGRIGKNASPMLLLAGGSLQYALARRANFTRWRQRKRITH
jgi:anaerobic selenocysteine-containing dehydrogenase